MRFSFSLLALAATITSSLAVPVDSYAKTSPQATCSYIDMTPVDSLLSASTQSAALQCFGRLCEAKRPFTTLPTTADCGVGRTWSIETPTAGYEAYFTNEDCVTACNSCIGKGVENGYRHAQCDVTVDGVFGTICRVYYNCKV